MATNEEELRRWAAGHHGACHSYGDPGYCDPEQANWAEEMLSADMLAHVWKTADDAFAWISAEIEMDKEEGLGRGWERLLVEPVREEIFCLVRDGNAYIWDGYHRAAALIATGRPIAAIVGRPIETEGSYPRPAH